MTTKILRIAASLFLATGIVTAGNPIEFCTVLHEFQGEGVVYHRLILKDADRTISFQPPAGWNCRGSADELRLSPPDKAFAEAKIRSIALEKPLQLDEQSLIAMADQVITGVPPASQQLAMVRQEQNQILLNNNPSYEVTVSYQVQGETFQRSVLFINTPANQIVFQFTARKSDFDVLYRAFRASVLTWELQPESGRETKPS